MRLKKQVEASICWHSEPASLVHFKSGSQCPRQFDKGSIYQSVVRHVTFSTPSAELAYKRGSIPFPGTGKTVSLTSSALTRQSLPHGPSPCVTFVG